MVSKTGKRADTVEARLVSIGCPSFGHRPESFCSSGLETIRNVEFRKGKARYEMHQNVLDACNHRGSKELGRGVRGKSHLGHSIQANVSLKTAFLGRSERVCREQICLPK